MEFTSGIFEYLNTSRVNLMDIHGQTAMAEFAANEIISTRRFERAETA